MLRTYELGSEAIAFIRTELALGGDLAALVAELPLESGRVVTYLPDSVSQQDLTDLDSGGVANGEETSHLANAMAEYLDIRAGTRRICAFEHSTSRRGDMWTPRVPFFTVAERVYLFLTGDTPREQFEVAAREAHGYPAIGLMVTLPQNRLLPEDHSNQDPALLSDLAGGMDHLIVGAYDEEAWLVWSRPR